MAVDKEAFRKTIDLIIANLEGGYYHPQMLADGRVKDARYGTSGETMFGIDRLHGGSLNTSDAGRKFWGIIDKAGAKNKWQWNYKGGTLGPELKSLVADMMYPYYENLSTKYLTPKAKAIVDKDPKLTFHFAYASWNGPGWFKNFAGHINDAVADGITSSSGLEKVALKSRLHQDYSKNSNADSLIAQGGKTIANLFQSAAFVGLDIVKKNKGKIVLIFFAATIIGGMLIYFNQDKK